MRRLGEVCEAFPFAHHLAEAVGMIGMFVGNQNSVDLLGFLPAKSFKAPQHFFFAEPGVNEESGVLGLKQRGVARTAGCKN